MRGGCLGRYEIEISPIFLPFISLILSFSFLQATDCPTDRPTCEHARSVVSHFLKDLKNNRENHRTANLVNLTNLAREPGAWRGEGVRSAAICLLDFLPLV